MPRSPVKPFLQRVARAIWIRLPRRLRVTLVRQLEPKFLLSVVAIPVAADGRILCVRHVFRPAAHPWGLPAGFLKHGESPQTAVLRELTEETGYQAQSPLLLEARLIQPHQLELIYRVQLGQSAAVRNFEITDSGLFPPDALPRGFLPSNLETLRRHGFPGATETRLTQDRNPSANLDP